MITALQLHLQPMVRAAQFHLRVALKHVQRIGITPRLAAALAALLLMVGANLPIDRPTHRAHESLPTQQPMTAAQPAVSAPKPLAAPTPVRFAQRTIERHVLSSK